MTTRWTLTALTERQLGVHAPAWAALNRQRFGDNPLLGAGFTDALLRHFGDGQEHLLIGHDPQGDVAAMLILRRGRAGLWSSFLPAQSQIGPSLLPPEIDPHALFQALPGWPLQMDLMCCDPSFNHPAIAALDMQELSWHATTISVALTGTFEAYWAGRPKKLQSNIRRYERKARTDHGELSYRVIDGSGDLAAGLTRYSELESRGWKGREGTAVDDRSGQLAFYRDAMQIGQVQSQARVCELWLGERLAASRLTIRGGQSIVMLKTTYDESLAAYAPGRLLLHHLIEDAFHSSPGCTVEFYTNANRDQSEWATHWRPIRHVSSFRRPWIKDLLPAADLVRQWRQLFRRGPAEPSDAVPAELSTVVDWHALPDPVAKLFEQTGQTDVQSSLAWFRNYTSTVRSDEGQATLYVLNEQGRASAALPMLVRPHGAGRRLFSLGNYYTTRFQPLVEHAFDNQSIERLLVPMLHQQVPVHSVCFMPLDPAGWGWTALRHALRRSGFIVFGFWCFQNWQLTVAGNWASYFAQREGSLRSTVKRMGRRFAARGGRIDMITGADGLAHAIAAYERVYAASWKAPEPHPDFMPGLIARCAEHGWLRLAIAWLDDQPIAAQVWIVAGRRADIYKLAHDEKYRELSPGTLLTAALMQHVIDVDRVETVDFLSGDDAYKQLWMDQVHERHGMVAYNPRTWRGLAGLGRELLGRALRPLLGRPRPSGPSGHHPAA